MLRAEQKEKAFRRRRSRELTLPNGLRRSRSCMARACDKAEFILRRLMLRGSQGMASDYERARQQVAISTTRMGLPCQRHKKKWTWSYACHKVRAHGHLGQEVQVVFAPKDPTEKRRNKKNWEARHGLLNRFLNMPVKVAQTAGPTCSTIIDVECKHSAPSPAPSVPEEPDHSLTTSHRTQSQVYS